MMSIIKTLPALIKVFTVLDGAGDQDWNQFRTLGKEILNFFGVNIAVPHRTIPTAAAAEKMLLAGHTIPQLPNIFLEKMPIMEIRATGLQPVILLAIFRMMF
jgi:hypothetical protein